MEHPFIRERHASTHLGVYDTPDDDSASTALYPVSTASAKTCLAREAALWLKFDGKDTDKIMQMGLHIATPRFLNNSLPGKVEAHHDKNSWFHPY
jgi:hypothetical protein